MSEYFYLPLPPSTNNLFANNRKTGGRYSTQNYKAWQEEAGWELKKQKVKYVGGKIKITYLVNKPDGKRRDLGNYEKALSDLLVKHSIIDDDSHIEEFSMRWDGRGHFVWLKIETYGQTGS
jgi:crossover junction endodeoxyribonuclease RusA